VESPFTLKTPSVHAAQKWSGRTTVEKLFASTNGETTQGVNVPGVAWRRQGDTIVGSGRGELTKEEVMRIKEEEETQFSME
jgi:hypothetical protein